MQTSVHYDAEAISTDLISRKRRNVSGTSSAESNWVGYPVEDNTEGEIHESFDVSGEILKLFFADKGITRKSLGSSWGITGELRLFIYQG